MVSLRPGRRTNQGSTPGRREAFPLPNGVQTSTVDHSDAQPMNTGSFRGRKLRRSEDHHLPTPTPTPPGIYMAQYLMKHRCTLTCPVKMNFSGWTKDVEDVSLLLKTENNCCKRMLEVPNKQEHYHPHVENKNGLNCLFTRFYLSHFSCTQYDGQEGP